VIQYCDSESLRWSEDGLRSLAVRVLWIDTAAVALPATSILRSMEDGARDQSDGMSPPIPLNRS
jgi:hypothetical protein